MSSRIVELKLQVEGAQTLEQMENALNEINTELSQVDVNSDAFRDLSKAAQEANGRIEAVNSQIEGVTSLQKAEGVVKLGEGLVGGFAAAQSAAALFGSESSEALQEAADQAVLLFTALDGLKRVTEAFSAENIKAYAAITKGITQSTVATRLFGTTTRAALTATGIGALIVAIGVLIANWEEVTGAVKSFGNSVRSAINDNIPFLGRFIDSIESIFERIGSLNGLLAGTGAVLRDIFTFNFDSLGESFAAAADEANRLNEAQEQLKEFNENTSDEIERQIALLEAKGGQEEKIFELKKQQLETQIELVRATGDENDELDDLENNLKILNIQEENRLLAVEKVRLEKQKEAQEERKAAAERRANIIAEQKELLTSSKNLQAEIDKIRARGLFPEQDFSEIFNTDELVGQFQLLSSNLEVEDGIFRFSGRLIDETGEIASLRTELNSLYERGINLFNEEYEIAEEIQTLQKQKLKLTSDYLTDKQGEIDRDNKIVELTEQALQLERERLLITLDVVEKEQEILDLKREQNLEELRNQADQERVNNLETRISLTNRLNDLSQRQSSNQAEELEINRDILILQNELAKLDKRELESQLRVNEESEGALLTAEEELNIRQQLANVNTQIFNNQRLLTREYSDQNIELADGKNILRDLNRQLKENRKEIQETGTDAEVLGQKIGEATQVLELLGQAISLAFEFNISNLSNQIGDTERELDALRREIDAFYEDQIDYEALLKDANGERYNEILENAKEQAKTEENLLRAEIDKENKIIEARNKIERTKQQQAVAEAAIQGAISVVQALPNLPLAAIVGALAAAQVALIANTDVPQQPPIPEFAEGGYTGDGNKNQVAGIVHAGEYVVPQKIVQTQEGSNMVATLEAMRKGFKGYQDGGIVQPPNAAGNVGMETSQVVNALENARIFVSVQEINDVNTNVRVIESRASL